MTILPRITCAKSSVTARGFKGQRNNREGQDTLLFMPRMRVTRLQFRYMTKFNVPCWATGLRKAHTRKDMWTIWMLYTPELHRLETVTTWGIRRSQRSNPEGEWMDSVII